MPDRTPCVHCQRVGFVRRERVIKGGLATSAYYCGACEYGWSVRDHNERRLAPRVAKVARDVAHNKGV